MCCRRLSGPLLLQQPAVSHGCMNDNACCRHAAKISEAAHYDSLFIFWACWSSIACTADDGASTAASALGLDQLAAAAPGCTASNSGSSTASLAAAPRRCMLRLEADANRGV